MEKKEIEYLEFIYNRMINVHQESENSDYMTKFREILIQLSEESKKVEALKPKCIHCGDGCTDKNPQLVIINAPGMYFQHWDFEKNKGCEKNKQNINPHGCKTKPTESCGT